MIYEKFMLTWNTQNIAGYFSCLHEDYQMVFHSTGKILRLEDFDTDQLTCLSPLELCQYILAKGVRKHGSKALF